MAPFLIWEKSAKSKSIYFVDIHEYCQPLIVPVGGEEGGNNNNIVSINVFVLN